MYRYTNISFPSLGIDINPVRAFSIGSLTVHMYGIVIGLGLLLAALYAMRRAKQFGLTEDHILDGVLWVTPFAVICARAYYCIFQWELYAGDPISVLYIWKGGIAIYGGVLGAVAGIIVFCRIKKLSLGAALDLVSLGFLIGQSIGRWGNFFNREAFGAETDSFLRMGLLDSFTGTVTYHHPTFLYESVWNALGFVILHFLSKKREYDGQIALGYVVWYGLGRAFIEGLRTDSLYIPGTELRVSQVLAAVSCLTAAAVLAYFIIKPPAKTLFVHRVAEKETETDEGGNEDA
ncbi:MAG: prolipoprotein diacylglyceryl transferase [Oscillospiraceae bacterium]|nr:prolipoprotein diacylglyceryl transferase [Oscillospiraceae bacterium]